MANGDEASSQDQAQATDVGFKNLGVVSSCFSSMEYNSDTKQLSMTFAKDGSRYMIDGIEEIEIDRWINSGSPGGYFNSFIRGSY
jgi:hypothetical protein